MINKVAFLEYVRHNLKTDDLRMSFKYPKGLIDSWSAFYSSEVPGSLLVSIEFTDGDYLEFSTDKLNVEDILHILKPAIMITDASDSDETSDEKEDD